MFKTIHDFSAEKIGCQGENLMQKHIGCKTQKLRNLLPFKT